MKHPAYFSPRIAGSPPWPVRDWATRGEFLKRQLQPWFVTFVAATLWVATLQPGAAEVPAPPPVARPPESTAAVKAGDCDLVLIGDSITHTLHNFGGKYAPLEAVWDKHYATRHAVNMGHNGIRTEGTLESLERGELAGKNPKVAVLLIGTNDTDERHYPTTHTPEQICEATQAIVASIRRQSPSTKILILRIFPRGGDDEKGVGEGIFHSSEKCIETARRAGELTAQLADGKQVFWLDVNHIFLRPDGTINTDLMPNLLHPNQAGAEAWAQAIEPLLAQLMGDRPILDPQPNALLVPAAGGDGTYDWMARHNSALKAKATRPQVVFIGDSITHHFGGIPTEGIPPASKPVWDRLFTNGRPAINLGFGADRVQQVLWRLDHGELDGLTPQRVVLMIGANHVLGGTETPETVVEGVRACLQRIRAKTPEARITLMAVLPCRNPASHPDRLKTLRINERLLALAQEAKVDFLDLGPKFLDDQGNIPTTLMSDAVHPTLAGYQIWGDALALMLP
jgi:lysophospholipase L1-like esterase